MIVEVLVIDGLADVDIVVVGVILKFALTVSYSTDVSSEVDVDLSKNGLIVGALSSIGIEVLPGVSAKAFAVVMTAWGFPLLTRLEEVSCC